MTESEIKTELEHIKEDIDTALHQMTFDHRTRNWLLNIRKRIEDVLLAVAE